MADFNFANNPGQPSYAGGLVDFMAPFKNQQQGQQQQQRPGQPQQGQPQWNQPQGPGNPMQLQGPNAGSNAPLPGTSFADKLKAFFSQQGGAPGFNDPTGPASSPTAIY